MLFCIAASSSSMFAAMAWIAPVVILFFFVGVYVGSEIMHNMNAENDSLGINNNVQTMPADIVIDRSVRSSLRGAAETITNSLDSVITNTVVSEPMKFMSPAVDRIPQTTQDNNLRVAIPPGTPKRSSHTVVSSQSKPNPSSMNSVVVNAPHKLVRLAPNQKQSSVITNTHQDDLDEHTIALKNSFPILNSNTFYTAPVDILGSNPNVLVGAWVYLDAHPFHDTDMRTIFSNKGSGCDKSEGMYGISLFINNWEQKDHQIYTEYGNAESGCNKLGTSGLTLETERWYHIAVLHSSNTVAIYLDGAVVAERIDAGSQILQRHRSMIIGQFEGGAFPFYGNISHVAVVHPTPLMIAGAKETNAGSLSTYMSNIVKSMMAVPSEVKDTPGLYALIPLNDHTKGSGVIYRPDNALQGKKLPMVGLYSGVGLSQVGGSVLETVSASGLVTGLADDRIVTADMIAESDAAGRIRREKVKAAMQRSWSAYKQYAFGYDELKPISKRGHNNWGGMGVTLVDSLDTLWVMGMRKEFDEAKDWVRDRLSFNNAGSVSVFETTIRELGGLLSAYDLSKDKVFLDKAEILGRKLLGAFDTPTGIARSSLNMKTGVGSGGWSGGSAILAELGTLQVEFRYLAHHLKDPAMEAKAMKGIQTLATKPSGSGLYPIKINTQNGGFADSMITFGALGDSFYEYLLKMWLQGGRKEQWLRDMYDRAMDGAVKLLLKQSHPSKLSFLSDYNGRSNFYKMDHLVCFMPGLLTLGAYTDPNGLDSPRAKRDLDVAKALMYTCYQMYHRTASGISPEYVEFKKNQDIVIGRTAPFYILRPETSESLFIMNQLTKDPIYRDW